MLWVRIPRVLPHAWVAQSVERGTENPCVGGSIPPLSTIYAVVVQLVERHLAKVEATGSRPVYCSIVGWLPTLNKAQRYH